MTFKFRGKYFIIAILLFLIEVFIAVYVNDQFVRPYVGDFLVVILIYYFLKSFWNTSIKVLALTVLAIAYAVEVLQGFKFVKLLGLGNSKLANVILGNSFEWGDLLAYTLGILLVVFIEKAIANQNK